MLGLFPIDLGQLGKITSSHATMTGRDLLVGRINQQSRMVVGERIHPVPIPASWLRRVGSYDIIDVGQEETLLDRLRLTVQDGFLVLTGRFTKPTPFEFTHALEPLSDTEAIVMGLGLGDGVTLKVIPRAGEEIVRYSRVYDETNVAGLNAVNGSQRLEVSSPNRAVGTSRA